METQRIEVGDVVIPRGRRITEFEAEQLEQERARLPAIVAHTGPMVVRLAGAWIAAYPDTSGITAIATWAQEK